MNMVKLLPFAYLGRITTESLALGGIMTPILPAGVFFGWWLTHKTQQKHYLFFIYITLFVTSIMLILST